MEHKEVNVISFNTFQRKLLKGTKLLRYISFQPQYIGNKRNATHFRKKLNSSAH